MDKNQLLAECQTCKVGGINWVELIQQFEPIVVRVLLSLLSQMPQGMHAGEPTTIQECSPQDLKCKDDEIQCKVKELAKCCEDRRKCVAA